LVLEFFLFVSEILFFKLSQYNVHP
jgi:hypothetical protein